MKPWRRPEAPAGLTLDQWFEWCRDQDRQMQQAVIDAMAEFVAAHAALAEREGRGATLQ